MLPGCGNLLYRFTQVKIVLFRRTLKFLGRLSFDLFIWFYLKRNSSIAVRHLVDGRLCWLGPIDVGEWTEIDD